MVAQPDFIADTLSGCDQLTVTFTIDTATVDLDTITAALWRFGNGSGNNNIYPQPVQYNVSDSTQQFDIALFLNNDTLNNSIIKNDYITVHKTYNARFYIQELNELNASFSTVPQKWTDPSANYQFNWNFSDGTSLSNGVNKIVHTFSDTGSYNISLRVTDDYGCTAQFDTTVVLNDSYDFPNILITSRNDYILYEYNNTIPIHFQVFTRSGIKVYESNAPAIYWDGRNLSGQYLNTGIYYYLIQSDMQSETLQHKGFIYIVSD
jgi:hypothetical protein